MAGRRIPRIPRPRSLASPALKWAGDAQDPWMVQFVRERMKMRDPWHAVVAAGACARLRTFADKSIGRRAMKGDFDAKIFAPREWALGLTAEQVADIRHYVSYETLSLHEMLDDLERSVAKGNWVALREDEGWKAQLVEALHRRDDIDSAMYILEIAGGSVDGLGIDTLDERGVAFVIQIPRFIGVDDRQLLRASVSNPEAWWVQPATNHIKYDDDDPTPLGWHES